MPDPIYVSSEMAKYFLTQGVAHYAAKLRSQAQYLQSAGKETLASMDQGRLPAWVYNHQAVQELYHAEGALIALRQISSCVLQGDDDRLAFEAILKDPDRQYFLTVKEPAPLNAIDAQMVGKPNGWYVFDDRGLMRSGSYEFENEAEDQRYEGDWVGQVDGGIVDISYAPVTIFT